MPEVEDNTADLDADYQDIARRQLIERQRGERRGEGIPPEFRTERTPPPAPRQSRITDPAVRAAIDQLPERVRPIAEAEYEALRARGGEGGAAAATAQRDLALARGEREARETYAQQHRAELERYRAKRVELPDFLPTQENAMSLGTLFGLVGVAGTLMGGKGQQSAIGAMNAMSGMMAGWRQGRTDLYNRERQKYEQEMRRVQEQNAVLQRDFQDALNVMKTDLDAGIARAREAAARHGVSIAGAAAARQGAEGVRNFMTSLRQTMMQLEQTQSRQTSQQPIVVPQRQADGTTRYYYAHRDGSLLMQNNQPVEAPPPRSAGTGRATGGAALERQMADVEGRRRFIAEYFGEGVSHLGPTEIKNANALLGAAIQSARLAEEIAANPQAAGLAESTIRRLERLDWTRYANPQNGEVSTGVLSTLIDSIFGTSPPDGERPPEGSPDQISAARRIAKQAVDVINARALAASGGSRMLVTELNLQKGVIGLSGMSPRSAREVYGDLAMSDLAKARDLGVPYDSIVSVRRRVMDEAKDYVGSGRRLPPERPQAAAAAPPRSEQPAETVEQYGRRLRAANPNAQISDDQIQERYNRRYGVQ